MNGSAEGSGKPERRWIPLLVGALLFGALLWAARDAGDPIGRREVSYTELLDAVEAGRVEHVEIGQARVVATLRAAPDAQADAQGTQADAEGTQAQPAERSWVARRVPGADAAPLLETLREHGVRIDGVEDDGGWSWAPLLSAWILPMLMLWLLWGFVSRRAMKGGPLALEGNRARIYDRNQGQRVTFADVAGIDEAQAELREIVSYLRDPTRYRSIGARPPKGVLLVGPPGTGKTLLARAVAGEADVPFFSIAGSDFVQMFVGVGAARVRDLFEQAKQRAPCIVFIDELDAIGRSRSGPSAMAAHEEREQTLDQLLVEMDGFEGGQGVVILAATNRPEILDRALLRAGRFDRQIALDRPDVRGREAILAVHAKKVKLAERVDLAMVARRTPGMAGADLANVVNEAALAAVRRGSELVDMRDFEEAIDRIQLGLRKQGRVMTEDERRRVAFHESGHALVALSVEHSDPVHRVTIIPRSIGALGATLQLPTTDRYLVTRAELRDRLAVMLGGRVAEELACDDISTGAENDLERATQTARLMVTRFGMSETLGAVSYGEGPEMRWLETMGGGGRGAQSEETARAIDREVRAILDEAHARARAVLSARHAVLNSIAERLLHDETLEGKELLQLVKRASASLAAE